MDVKFEDLGLKEEILTAISEMGYEKPTPVQSEAITHLMASHQDLVALAQTGTGKTAAFSLPVIHQIDTSLKKIQALVLSPTRELGIQIAKNIEQYTKHIPGFRSVAVYGGSSIDAQIRTIKRGVQVVVGTPGRTLDLIKRKKLDFSNIRWLVLDEADEMLSMGFTEDLNSILEGTPDEKQTLLFSATMPPEINRIAKNYMKDPKSITIGTKNTGAKNVEHHYYLASARDRYIALKRIVDMHPKIYAIIFCRTRRETKEIADSLSQEGYNADAIHGDVSQVQREYVMNRFRSKQLQLLVATDVAARGVDVDDLTHVINYNLPDDPEIYVHRSGRTGRAGKEGVSICIVHSREQHKLRQVEKMVKKTFDRKMIPTGAEICQTQLFSLLDKMKNVEVKEEEIATFLPAVLETLTDLSREDLIKQFVSLEFNRFLKYYENAPDINITKSNRNDRRDRNSRGGRRDNSNFARFHINVGHKHNILPKDIIALINRANKRDRVAIGQIDIMKSFSFFEIDAAYAENLPTAFNKMTFKGTPLMVEPSKPKKNNYSGGGGNYRRGGRSSDRPKRPKRRNRKPF